MFGICLLWCMYNIPRGLDSDMFYDHMPLAVVMEYVNTKQWVDTCWIYPALRWGTQPWRQGLMTGGHLDGGPSSTRGWPGVESGALIMTGRYWSWRHDNENVFRITGSLWGEWISLTIPLKRTSDAELWRFICSCDLGRHDAHVTTP